MKRHLADPTVLQHPGDPSVPIRAGRHRLTAQTRLVQDMEQVLAVKRGFEANYTARLVKKYYPSLTSAVEAPLA